MDFHELEYLIAIEQYGSLTAASKELFVSQPTLTKLVQRVENELGTPLFEHIGRKMKPTYAGERYLWHVKKILAQKKAMDTELEDILSENSGSLVVGMPPFRCAYTLGEILPDFSKKYPNVTFQFVESDSSDLDHLLVNGDVDLAFYILLRRNSHLCYEHITRDKPVAIFAKGHSLEKKATEEGCIHLSDLKDQSIIIQGTSQRLGQYVTAMLEEHHIKPGNIMMNTNLRASAALAVNGYGIAFSYEGFVKDMNLPGEYNVFPVAEFTLSADNVVAYRETFVLPEYAEYFIQLMKDHYKKSSRS